MKGIYHWKYVSLFPADLSKWKIPFFHKHGSGQRGPPKAKWSSNRLLSAFMIVGGYLRWLVFGQSMRGYQFHALTNEQTSNMEVSTCFRSIFCWGVARFWFERKCIFKQNAATMLMHIMFVLVNSGHHSQRMKLPYYPYLGIPDFMCV